MKNRSISLNLIIVVVLLLFTTTFIYSFGITDDFGYGRSKFEALGFEIGKIVRQKDGSYKVDVVGYTKTSKAITLLKGKFIPFQVNFRVERTVHILKSDLKNYSVNSKHLKPDIKIVPKLSRIIKIKKIK